MSCSVLSAETAIARAPRSAATYAALSGQVSPAAPVGVIIHRPAKPCTAGLRSGGLRSGGLRRNGAIVWPTGPPGGVAG